jgi:hypothetical protein
MSLQKGLVGHWTFDAEATSNGTAYDSSAYDNHGSINGATPVSSGKISGSFDFEHDNSEYIDLGRPVLNDNPFTVSCWCTIESHTGDWMRTVASHDTSNGIWLGLDNNGTNWQAGMRRDDSSSATVSASSFNTGQWYHTVIRWDGSTFEFFLDTDSIGATSSSTFNPAVDNTNIGRSQYYGEYWDGKIDDIRVYNRALSESEINQLYQMRTQGNAYL